MTWITIFLICILIAVVAGATLGHELTRYDVLADGWLAGNSRGAR